MTSKNEQTYEEKKAAFWVQRKALLAKHYAPKYPCMVTLSVTPTNGDLIQGRDCLVKTFYLPDIFRRMIVAIYRRFYPESEKGS